MIETEDGRKFMLKDTPENREFLEFLRETKEKVNTWPAWKKGGICLNPNKIWKVAPMAGHCLKDGQENTTASHITS